MPSNDVVAGFIRASFRSVWALEQLCHLRQNRSRALSKSEMVAELRGVISWSRRASQLVDFLSGVITLGLVVAGLFFLRS